MNDATKNQPLRIAELRKSSKLTQSELAKLMDLDVTTVCKHELGTRNPTKPEIEKYARIFNVSSYELFLAPEKLEG